jgi:hypothetical protein
MKGATAIAVGASVVASVLVWTMAGCGGDNVGSESSDKEEIKDVFEAYKEAARDGDAERLCEDILAPSQLGSESVEQCAQIDGQAFTTPRITHQLAAVELGHINIRRNYARASNATQGGYFEFRPRKGVGG